MHAQPRDQILHSNNERRHFSTQQGTPWSSEVSSSVYRFFTYMSLDYQKNNRKNNRGVPTRETGLHAHPSHAIRAYIHTDSTNKRRTTEDIFSTQYAVLEI